MDQSLRKYVESVDMIKYRVDIIHVMSKPVMRDLDYSPLLLYQW